MKDTLKMLSKKLNKIKSPKKQGQTSAVTPGGRFFSWNRGERTAEEGIRREGVTFLSYVAPQPGSDRVRLEPKPRQYLGQRGTPALRRLVPPTRGSSSACRGC